MPRGFSSDQLARLRDDARLLVSWTGGHRDRLEALVRVAERDMRNAEEMAADSFAVGSERLRDFLAADLRRAAQNCLESRRLCVAAHQQHIAAMRLLNDIDPVSDAGDATSAGEPRIVLVVDDHAELRRLLTWVLEDAGFVVQTAANGLEGLIAACQMRPAVIVMDVTMPILSGIEAARLIKANEATRRTRVIAYTGESSITDDLVPSLFETVVPKPSPPEVVLAAVRRATAH